MSGAKQTEGDTRRFKIPDAGDLQQLRLIAGLTKSEAARRGGWAENTVARWESGQTSPRTVDCAKLLEIYRKERGGQ